MTGLLRGLAIAALATLVSACGGSNPQSPTGACGGVAVGPLGCAKGMMTGTIGVQPFNGGVPTEPRDKRGDLGRTQLAGMATAMEDDEATDPMPIGILGSPTVVPRAKVRAHLMTSS